MTEQMDVEPGDIRALLGAANHEPHGLDSERLPLNREEEVRRLDGRPEVVPVPPQGSHGAKANRDRPLAIPLPNNLQLASVEVCVGQHKVAELPAAKPSVEER